MMKSEEIEKISEKERLFAIAVLSEAKRIFGDDAVKIDAKRMMILVCMVAKEIGYPLTMGWYK